MKITPALRIGIIGGEGRTGSQFASLFRAQGFSVDVTGVKTKANNAAIIRDCDIVIFALPLISSAKEIQKLCKEADRHNQLILDLSSLKQQQVKAMLMAKGEVIGMHPLFGPMTDPQNETMILCPARYKPETLLSLKKTLHAMGLKTVEKTPTDHDRLMAVIQALPHFKSLLMASILKFLKADLDQITDTCTPTYEIEFNVIGRFLDDSPELYMPIIFSNPQMPGILKQMQKELNHYRRIAEKGDLTTAAKDYVKLKKYFGSHAPLSRKRSEACIRLLASLS